MDDIQPYKKRGPKPKISGVIRIQLAARVKPATKAEVERRAAVTGKSIGELLDDAVEKTRADY